MKNIIRISLERLRKIKRKQRHPLLHRIHKKHNISKKTLFYVKEYGAHTNIPKTIIKESIKILLFASIISSFGGFALEQIKIIFISIIPLVILLPTLNDMIGDYGTIISSKFSTLLHENKVSKKWWMDNDIKRLFYQIFIIAMITAIISSFVALIISVFSNYSIDKVIILKIFFISLVDVAILVNILFFTAILSGIYLYKKKEDPNNFLIPITTSIADFGNMFILTALILLFF